MERITKILPPLLGLLLVVYGILQFVPLIRGPVITILSPKPGSTLYSGITTVTAHGARATSARINGYPVAVDTQGNFALDVYIAPGINSIAIETKNRYGSLQDETMLIWATKKSED